MKLVMAANRLSMPWTVSGAAAKALRGRPTQLAPHSSTGKQEKQSPSNTVAATAPAQVCQMRAQGLA